MIIYIHTVCEEWVSWQALVRLSIPDGQAEAIALLRARLSSRGPRIAAGGLFRGVLGRPGLRWHPDASGQPKRCFEGMKWTKNRKDIKDIKDIT